MHTEDVNKTLRQLAKERNCLEYLTEFRGYSLDKKILELCKEEVCELIGLKLFLDILIPIAYTMIKENPIEPCIYSKGFFLCTIVLKIDDLYWQNNPEYLSKFQKFVFSILQSPNIKTEFVTDIQNHFNIEITNIVIENFESFIKK